MSCHSGPDAGRHAVDLRDLHADAISTALHDFREGRRSGTVMPRLARALTDDDIDDLALALGNSDELNPSPAGNRRW